MWFGGLEYLLVGALGGFFFFKSVDLYYKKEFKHLKGHEERGPALQITAEGLITDPMQIYKKAVRFHFGEADLPVMWNFAPRWAAAIQVVKEAGYVVTAIGLSSPHGLVGNSLWIVAHHPEKEEGSKCCFLCSDDSGSGGTFMIVSAIDCFGTIHDSQQAQTEGPLLGEGS